MLEKIMGLFRDVDVWIIGRSLGEIFLIYMVVYIVLRIMQGSPRNNGFEGFGVHHRYDIGDNSVLCKEIATPND